MNLRRHRFLLYFGGLILFTGLLFAPIINSEWLLLRKENDAAVQCELRQQEIQNGLIYQSDYGMRKVSTIISPVICRFVENPSERVLLKYTNYFLNLNTTEEKIELNRLRLFHTSQRIYYYYGGSENVNNAIWQGYMDRNYLSTLPLDRYTDGYYLFKYFIGPMIALLLSILCILPILRIINRRENTEIALINESLDIDSVEEGEEEKMNPSIEQV